MPSPAQNSVMGRQQFVPVIGVEEGVVPDPTAITANDEDPLAHAQDVQRERCVLFVACTRAREPIPRHSSSAAVAPDARRIAFRGHVPGSDPGPP